MSEQLAEVLDQVAELVARGPCVRAAARDADGNIVAVMAPSAVCFCPLGAAMRVTRSIRDGGYLYMLALDRMHEYARMQRSISLPAWNDVTPHDVVAAAIRKLAEVEREDCPSPEMEHSHGN